MDSQQDFCVIRTNVTDQNVYVAFERFVITSDTNDIGFSNNVFLMFSLGSYSPGADSNAFTPRYHTFRIALQTSISLLNCVAGNNEVLPWVKM